MVAILGEENPNETGMFKHFYWTLPLAKYVEIYGLDDFEISMGAIEEITKRGTGEYAVRSFIKKYPQDSLKNHDSVGAFVKFPPTQARIRRPTTKAAVG